MSLKKIVSDSFNLIKEVKTEILKTDSKRSPYLSDLDFRKEHATIRLSLPRRGGNTTLALRCLESFEGSVLIVRNKSLLKNNKKTDRIYTLNRIYTLKDNSISNMSVPVVIVDDSTCADLIKIYKVKADVYILLG